MNDEEKRGALSDIDVYVEDDSKLGSPDRETE